MTTPLQPVTDGEHGILPPLPDESYVPTPRYEPPLPRNVYLGPLCVSVLRCPQCGAIFAHWGETLYDTDERCCPRCQLVPLTVPPDVAAMMAHVRWKLDEWRHAGGLSGVSREQHRLAFYAASQACWIHGPALLGELERVYGNQVLAQTQAIATGG